MTPSLHSVTLADRQRERAPRNGKPDPESSPATEQHYSPAQIAKLWGASPRKITDIFENEPGVVVLGSKEVPPSRKRRRMFLRVPESVLERKHTEMSNKRRGSG